MDVLPICVLNSIAVGYKFQQGLLFQLSLIQEASHWNKTNGDMTKITFEIIGFKYCTKKCLIKSLVYEDFTKTDTT